MRPIEDVCKNVANVIRNLRKHGNTADSLMTHDTELIDKLCGHLNVERKPEKALGKRLVTELLKKY